MTNAITITTNIDAVLADILGAADKLKNKDYLLRPVAQETILNMKERIHINGEDSKSKQIGTYSSSYLNYRKKNGRGAGTKIIVSMTRMLENSWQDMATEKGYGIGFSSPLSIQKARWVEEQKGVKIFELTESEKEYCLDRINELTIDALNT